VMLEGTPFEFPCSFAKVDTQPMGQSDLGEDK
jgi:hypothetical protein